MKNIFYLLLIPFLLTACSKQNPTQEMNDKTLVGKKGNKVTICHVTNNGWQTIEVSANAVSAHIAHGDILPDADGDGYTGQNPCGIGDQSDCNDDDPLINPGMEENCSTPYDDNCDGNVNESCCPEFQIGTMNFYDYFDFETGTVYSSHRFGAPPEFEIFYAYNSNTSIHAHMSWNGSSTQVAQVLDQGYCDITCEDVSAYYFCAHNNDPHSACHGIGGNPQNYAMLVATSEGNIWVVQFLSENGQSVYFKYHQLENCN